MARLVHMGLGNVEFRAYTWGFATDPPMFWCDIRAFDRDDKEIPALRRHIRLEYEGAVEFWQNYNADLLLEQLVADDVKAAMGSGKLVGFDNTLPVAGGVLPDAHYLPDVTVLPPKPWPVRH